MTTEEIQYVRVVELNDGGYGILPRGHTGGQNFNSRYMDMLIKDGILELDSTYDVTAQDFIQAMMSTKTHITVEHYDPYKRPEIITDLFDSEVVVNNRLFCNFGVDSNLPEGKFGEVRLNNNDSIVQLYKVNGKFYEKNALKKHVPQTIRIVKNGYYALNGSGRSVDSGSNYGTEVEDIYLFANNAPWLNEHNYANYHAKYSAVCGVRKCINDSKFTHIFL